MRKLREVEISRIRRHGGSICCAIPPAVLDKMALKMGDMVAIRIQGPYMVMQRVSIDELAKLREGPVPQRF